MLDNITSKHPVDPKSHGSSGAPAPTSFGQEVLPYLQSLSEENSVLWKLLKDRISNEVGSENEG